MKEVGWSFLCYVGLVQEFASSEKAVTLGHVIVITSGAPNYGLGSTVGEANQGV